MKSKRGGSGTRQFIACQCAELPNTRKIWQHHTKGALLYVKQRRKAFFMPTTASKVCTMRYSAPNLDSPFLNDRNWGKLDVLKFLGCKIMQNGDFWLILRYENLLIGQFYRLKFQSRKNPHPKIIHLQFFSKQDYLDLGHCNNLIMLKFCLNFQVPNIFHINLKIPNPLCIIFKDLV